MGEKIGDSIIREFGTDKYTLLYLKWITNNDLLIAQGTLHNSMWQPEWEGNLGKNGYVYNVWLSPSAVHLKLSKIINWLYSNIKLKII